MKRVLKETTDYTDEELMMEEKDLEPEFSGKELIFTVCRLLQTLSVCLCVCVSVCPALSAYISLTMSLTLIKLGEMLKLRSH